MATACPSDHDAPARTGIAVLLRPGWLIAALLVALFTTACFTVMGPWQLGKNDALEHRTAVLEQPASALGTVVAAGAALDPADEWRRVVVRGHYLADTTVQLPHRASGAQFATHLLTPFRDAVSGAVILVNRGFVPAEDAAAHSAGVPGGEITIEAHARTAEETSRFSPPRVEDGTVVASAIDPARLAETIDLPLASFYLQLAPGQAGSLGELLPPSAAAAMPHFSYGLQWLVFGLLAPIALIAAAVRAVRA